MKMRHPVTGAVVKVSPNAFNRVHRRRGWLEVSEDTLAIPATPIDPPSTNASQSQRTKARQTAHAGSQRSSFSGPQS